MNMELTYCNTAVRDLTDIYTQLPRADVFVTPVPSSQCYRPTQHLIPQNFQPYSQQNICLSIISVKGLLLRLIQGKYRDNKAIVTQNNIHWFL